MSHPDYFGTLVLFFLLSKIKTCQFILSVVELNYTTNGHHFGDCWLCNKTHRMKNLKIKSVYQTLLFVFVTLTSTAQEVKNPASDAAELAKKLSNPIANMISVPFQNNTDYGIGSGNGSRNTLNFQPVIPVKLSKSLNLITRTILPIVSQHNITGDKTKQSGLGDAVLSAWFSPADSKITWGVGPAFLIPTATDKLLGTEKFGIGPTAIVLKQSHGITVGALMNQLWSVAGSDSRSDVSQLFVQPFLVYNWKSGAGIGVNSEITQNWIASTTTVFINPNVSAVTKLGTQIVSIAFGPRIPVAAPSAGKSDFGWRASLTFVFPK